MSYITNDIFKILFDFGIFCMLCGAVKKLLL